RLHHHVEQMRDRRALVAADVAHARLQQRLGDGQNSLAAEGVSRAELECLHFGLERAFHRGLGRKPCVRSIIAGLHFESYRPRSVIPGRRKAASPESITTALSYRTAKPGLGVMDSGLLAFARPRNDGL